MELGRAGFISSGMRSGMRSGLRRIVASSRALFVRRAARASMQVRHHCAGSRCRLAPCRRAVACRSGRPPRRASVRCRGGARLVPNVATHRASPPTRDALVRVPARALAQIGAQRRAVGGSGQQSGVAARADGTAARIPGIAGGAEEPAAGMRARARLGPLGLADDDGAGRLHARDMHAVSAATARSARSLDRLLTMASKRRVSRPVHARCACITSRRGMRRAWMACDRVIA